MTVIKGIDVSKHNGKINWSKVKDSGIKFVIIRAGYGSNTIDERFEEYIRGPLRKKLMWAYIGLVMPQMRKKQNLKLKNVWK